MSIGSRKIYSSITRVLRLVWVFLVLFGELCVFFWSLVGCSWPSLNKTHQQVPMTHVLLLADTQIQHPALFAEGSWWSNSFRHILFELNLRKSWRVTSRLKPDAVIFLGDMLSNGKGARSSEAYAAGVQKFKSLFHVNPQMEVYYVPGNNDVGLGLSTPTSQKLHSYYTSSFGPLNYYFHIQNHTFVALDSPGLVDEDYVRHSLGVPVPFEVWTEVPDGSVAFVNRLARTQPERVILLSHIPLSRPDAASCGPLRERGTIRRGAGTSWQSMLGKTTTNFLLRNLQPQIVFSADNRDYCDYTHVLSPHSSEGRRDSIREITLKSFSMSVHIRRPGFQLLTLIDPEYISSKVSSPSTSDSTSILERPCFLPDQYRIYTSLYMPLLVLSFILLAYINVRKPKSSLANGGTFRHKNPGLTLMRSSATPISLAGSRSVSGSSGPSSPLLNGAGQWSPFVPLSPAMSSTDLRSYPAPSHMRTSHPPNASSATPLFVSPQSGTPVSFGEGGYFGEEEDEDEDVMFPAQYVTRLELQGRSVSGSNSRSYSGDMSGRRGHVRQGSESFDLEALRSFKPNGVAGISDREDTEVDLGGSSSYHLKASNHKNTTTSSSDSIASLSSSPLRNGSSTRKDNTATMASSTEGYAYQFTFCGRRRRVALRLPFCSRIKNLMEFVFGIGDGDGSFLGLKRRRKGGGGLNGFVLDVLDVFWPAMVIWVLINLVVLL